jgi:beta-galactosidase
MKQLVLPLVACFCTCASAFAAVTFPRAFAPEEGWVKPLEQPFRQELCLNGRWQFQPLLLPHDWKRDTGTAPELPPPIADKWEPTLIKIPSP